jgi:hypothetical protein
VPYVPFCGRLFVANLAGHTGDVNVNFTFVTHHPY